MIIIIFITVLISSVLYSQINIKSIKEENSSLVFELENNISYTKEKINNIETMKFYSFLDESREGEAIFPKQDLFIAIPPNSIAALQYEIVQTKSHNAIPEFNPQIELNEKKEIIYKDVFLPKKSDYKFIENKGYLWLGKNYCVHVQVSPFEYIGSNGGINEIFTYKLILIFDTNDLNKSNYEKQNEEISSLILNKDFASKYQAAPNYYVKSSDDWIDYSKHYIKIGTGDDGIYRINKDNLDSYGINTQSIDPSTFKLFLKGEEVPIYLEGESDFSFDSNDFIEFVGIRNMSWHHREIGEYDLPYNEYLGQYTDTTIYWLTWDGVDGKRVGISNGNEVTSNDTLDFYSQIEHYEKNNWFDFSCASLVRREMPYWIENKTWVEGQLHVGKASRNFQMSNVYPNKPAFLFAKLQDYASNISTQAHYLAIGINNNGNYYDSTYLNKYEKTVLSAEINSNLLIDGTNSLQVHSFTTDASINSCATDWYEIEYPRYLIPMDSNLNFFFPFVENSVVKNISLQNIASDSFSLWKYGLTYKKYSVDRINGDIAFADTVSANDKFTYMDESKILTPKIYYTKQFENLRSSDSQADYIAITHKKFKTKVAEYAEFISDNYQLATKIVDINDIYDEYSFGFFNPDAIKDFLKSTHNNWQESKPQNVVLIGGATYDYYGNKFKNFSAITERVLNYVPSFGASVSDTWFVTWDTTGAYIPQMNIGRLPVTTIEELEWYFVKHKNYVSQEYDDWNKRYIFFSSGNENSQSELDLMRESNQFVIDNYTIPSPIGGISDHFYKTILPPTNFGPYSQEYFQNVIDNGAVFISYLGHSGTQTWDNSITNPAQLKNNKNRYPIVSDFGCSTGRFAESDVVSFSQLFTIGNDGQALAYIGNASLGFVSTSLLMPKLFYKKILQENIFTVSKAHKEAKIEMLQTYGSTGIYKLFSLTNTYFGDPLLSLPIPQKPNFVVKAEGVQVKSNLLTDMIDSIEVKIDYYNFGSVIGDTLEILYIHEFQGARDSNIVSLEIPSSEDSLSVKLFVKGRAGNHSLKVILDPNSKYDELSKNDNIGNLTFNIASSSIRPIINYKVVNGIKNEITFLNPTSQPVAKSIILDLSASNDFSNINSHEVTFDSTISNFDISKFVDNKRYWVMTKIKGETSYSSPFAFVRSQEKFYLVDSLSFMSGLQRNININNFTIAVLDSIIIKFEILSASHYDGSLALIKMNGINYISDGTLTGHYVTLFEDSTYSFIQSLRFDLLNGGTEAQTNYKTFLDTVSTKYLVMIAIKEEGYSNLSNEIKAKIKALGSQYIDDVTWAGSWAFIGKKGAVPGTMPEAYSKSGDGPVTIDTTISFLSEKGSMLTSEIGPTGKWDRLVVDQETPTNSVITYTPIGIKENGVLDTLNKLILSELGDDVGLYADLSFIDSKIYPKMKILADFTASDDKQSPVLKSLGVDYNDVAELAMNYQVVSVEKDSIIQGDKNKLSFFIYNVGETKADSVSVKIELQKSDNTSILLDEFTTSVDSSSKNKFEYDFEILNSYGFGEMAYSIIVDEDEKITEFFKDNNFFQIPFYVKKDTITSVNSTEIQVKFDGFDIMDGDFVSNKPNILFELNYSGSFPTEDTSAVIFTMDNKRINYSSMNVDYDTINKSIKYSYDPEIKDGQHFLKAYGNSNLLGNNFGTEKFFIVSNKLKAVDIFNFPNPASNETYFTFRLSKVPEELNVKIFTIAGRLIKTFDLQSYDLKTDLNKIYWDLTDEDGDNIANGVYLYKVVLKAENKVEHYTQKLAIVR
jgi:peptidase C25-like protein/interleukin-like EMT inducer protein/CARDB protein